MSALTPAQITFLERFVIGGPLPKAAAGTPVDSAAFQAELRRAETVAARVAKLSADAQALLRRDLDPFLKGLAQVRSAADKGDIAAAAATLEAIEDHCDGLEARAGLAKTYAIEARGFARRLAEARSRRNDGGATAIGDYITRMETDDDRRAKAEARGDLRAALAICEALDNRHGAMMQDADRGRDYARMKLGLEKQLAKLRGTPQAEELIEDVRDLMQSAENCGSSGNWVGATTAMGRAVNELTIGMRGIDLGAKLNTDVAGKDFDTAYAGFLKALKTATRTPGARAFARDLRAARDKGEGARKALPDTARALEELGEAVQACKALVPKMLEHARYNRTAMTMLRQMKDLRALNIDRCIQPDLSRAGAEIKAAAKAAKAGDTTTALKRLTAAESLMGTAHAAGSSYVAVLRDIRRRIARALKDGTGDASVLRDLFGRIDKAYAARDLRTAEALAREASGQIAA